MKDGYAVLRFGLLRGADGSCSQNIQQCGIFDSVESAFDTARLEVLREWQETHNNQDFSAPKKLKLEIRDTEWGYDLKQDHLTVARFWVHDGSPANIPGLDPNATK
jgi:hypothetical protein